MGENGCGLASAHARLSHPDGGVVEEGLAALDVHPEDPGDAGQGLARRGHLAVGQQQADAGEEGVKARAHGPAGGQRVDGVPYRVLGVMPQARRHLATVVGLQP